MLCTCSIERNITKKYKGRWESFQRDMLLLFENARTYNAEGSEVRHAQHVCFSRCTLSRTVQVYEDAAALEKVFRKKMGKGEERGGAGKRRRPSEDDDDDCPIAAAAAAAKVPRREKASSKAEGKRGGGSGKRRRSSNDGGGRAAAAPKAARTEQKPEQSKSELMLGAWKAVREAKDGRRERAEIFVQLPSKEELPVYYEIIGNPMDLRTVRRPPAHHPTDGAFGLTTASLCPQVRERIDEGKYRRWDNFERDMMLIFENAKLFNMEGSEIHADAVVLEQVFKAQPAPAAYSRK